MTATPHPAPAAGPRFQFVPFADLANWSVRFALETRFHYNPAYPLRSLGSFLQRVKDEVTIQDQTTYQRVTVRVNNRGVVPRDTAIGRSIGTKRQFRVMPGQFLLSRIDARHGATGLVPSVLAGAVVTADFLAFEVDQTQVNPDFLVLITSTQEFIRFCQSCSSGTTNRQRLDAQLFLDVKIPLPSLPEQARLVADYHAKMQQAQQQRAEAEELTASISAYLEEQLGMESVEIKREKKMLYLVDFNKLSRWDVWNAKSTYASAKYENGTFSQAILAGPMYGANTKAVDRVTDTRYIRITDINEEGALNNEIVSAQEVEEKYLLQENDFLFARSGNTVGKSFLYKEEYGRAIFAGYLVKYKLDLNKINPLFLSYFTKSRPFKVWIAGKQRVSGQPNINGQEFLSAPIVLPPMQIQDELVAHISAVRLNSRGLRIASDALEANAIAQFEDDVFETNVYRRKA
jgi:type I restriction enzyme S subunit